MSIIYSTASLIVCGSCPLAVIIENIAPSFKQVTNLSQDGPISLEDRAFLTSCKNASLPFGPAASFSGWTSGSGV